MLPNSVRKYFHDILVHLSKLTIIILSVLGLIYQTWPIYQTYLNGNTVVNVDISDNFDYFPTFTICYDRIFNLHSLPVYNATFKKMYDELLSYIHEDYGIKEYRNYSNISNETLMKLTKIYDTFENEAYKWFIDGNHSNIDPVELFDNITIPFYRLVNEDQQSAIKVQLFTDIGLLSLTPMPEVRPIESIMNLQHSPHGLDYESHCGKCFTFFSDLQPKLNSIRYKKSQYSNIPEISNRLVTAID